MSTFMRSTGFRLTIISLVLAVLSGCFGGDGMFRDRGQDYRRAKLAAPLELPPSMRSAVLDDKYVVPGIQTHKPLPGDFELQPPEPLAQNVGTAEVKIQTLANQSWILLDGDPNQVWPRMRIFLGGVGLEIAKADGEAAILETQWRDPVGDGTSRERFRFRLDEGVHQGTSEIHLTVQVKGNDQWPAKSDDLAREAQMIRVVAQYLADQETAGVVSILAQRSDGKGKIFIEGGDAPDGRHLRLELPVDRAWAALGLALTKAGFEIEGDRRELNQYMLSYVDPEAGPPSWFARMFGKPSEELSRYVVEMEEVGPEEARIYLNYQEGRRLDDDEREKLLIRIMGYLY